MTADESSADQLRQWRESAGLTQDEAARLLGVTGKTISRWETGAPVKAKDLAAARHAYSAATQKGLDKKVPRGTRADPDDHWSPNPSLRNAIPKRAYDVAIAYCYRLAAAGLERNEIEALERVMIDSRYAKANSRKGRELSEEDWILLVDDAWDAIRETLAGRGVRV